MRGGGGNFGVVTSFLFQAHPVRRSSPARCSGRPTDAEMLRWYRRFMPTAPEDLYGFFGFMNVPPVPLFPEHLHGKPVCGVVWCTSGSPEQAQKDWRSSAIRSAAFELSADAVPRPQSCSTRSCRRAQWYWRGDFFKEIARRGDRQHAKYGADCPPCFRRCTCIRSMARHRVGRNETAFSYRDAKWSMVIAGIDPDPANSEMITHGRRTTGMPCIRTPRAAPTSTS